MERKDKRINIGIIPKARNTNLQVGLLSSARGDVKGVQAGLGSYAEEDVKGVQAGLFSGANNVYGVQAGLFSGANNVYGVQAGVLSYTTGDVKGVQAGVFSFANGDVKGVQAGVVSHTYGDVKGVQAGVFSFANNVKGVQAGLFSYAEGENSNGLQLGLLLWGSGNKWWNPSVFVQRLYGNKEVRPFGTLEKVLMGSGKLLKKSWDIVKG